MEFRRAETDPGQLLFCYYFFRRILILIHFRADSKSSICFCASNELYDRCIAYQRAAAPVLCDMAEHTMFNLVPFTGSRWKVADFQAQAKFVGQLLQRHLPQACAAAVTASAVCRNQQLLGVRVSPPAHLSPPSPDRGRGESGGVVIDAHTHPAFIVGDIVHPIGNGLLDLRIGKVMDQDLDRPPPGQPFPPRVPVRAHQLFLLRVHRDHGLTASLKPSNLFV